MSESELRVRKIQNGTVIDHISAGNALAVLRILRIAGQQTNVVSLLMNVPSKTLKSKDIVKIEGREISPSEVDQIALISPQATINIIRNYNVVDKKRVKLPRIIKEIVACPNTMCISNGDEPVKAMFHVESEKPPRLRCYYCGTALEEAEIIKQF